MSTSCLCIPEGGPGRKISARKIFKKNLQAETQILGAYIFHWTRALEAEALSMRGSREAPTGIARGLSP